MNKILSKEVSFDLAKLLKEKGFDFSNDRIICKCCNNPISINDINNNKIIKIKDGGYIHWSCSKSEIVKPTISDVVDWIFEKYNIWISVDCTTINNNIPKFHFKTIFIKDLGNEMNYDGDMNKEKFNTPTEAYEEAIKYVLNY